MFFFSEWVGFRLVWVLLLHESDGLGAWLLCPDLQLDR